MVLGDANLWTSAGVDGTLQNMLPVLGGQFFTLDDLGPDFSPLSEARLDDRNGFGCCDFRIETESGPWASQKAI